MRVSKIKDFGGERITGTARSLEKANAHMQSDSN